MPIKMFRRDKSARFVAEVWVFGPFSQMHDGEIVENDKMPFAMSAVKELDSAGNVAIRSREIGKWDLISGSKYLLYWRLSGAVGDEINLYLDRANDPRGAQFVLLASDKIPAAGNGLSNSRQTNAGFVWSNSIVFVG